MPSVWRIEAMLNWLGLGIGEPENVIDRCSRVSFGHADPNNRTIKASQRLKVANCLRCDQLAKAEPFT